MNKAASALASDHSIVATVEMRGPSIKDEGDRAGEGAVVD